MNSKCIVSAACLFPFLAFGETNEWQTAGTGSWHDAANWSLGHAPVAGEDVRIACFNGQNPVVNVTQATPRLASLTLIRTYGSNSATVMVSGWDSCISADEIYVGNATTIRNDRTPIEDDSSTNRVWLAGGTLTVEAGGKILADQCGWLAHVGPSWVNYRTGTIASGHTASHGGWDVLFQGYDTWPLPYGDPEWPILPGSTVNATFKASNMYLPGGAIRLDFTGDVVINGLVSACGRQKSSGGSILIVAQTVSGSGWVSANGFLNNNDGSPGVDNTNKGAGGRVAVHYNPTAQAAKLADCTIKFSARGGFVNNPSPGESPSDGYREEWLSDNGTLWFTDNQFLTSPTYRSAGLPFAGVWKSGVPLASLAYEGDLSLSNCFLEFEGLESFTVNGNLSATGIGAYARAEFGLKFLDATAVAVTGNVALAGARLELACGGSLDVTGNLEETSINTSYLWGGAGVVVRGAWTNGVDGAYGATVNVGGTWHLAEGSTFMPYCNPTNGSIVAVTAGSVMLDDGATIDAKAKGWRCMRDSASTVCPNYGPARGGSTKRNNITYNYGAAHGGRGGAPDWTEGSNAWYAQPVGDEFHPLLAGSRGTGNVATFSCHGGGVVFLTVADKLTLNGEINADAVQDWYDSRMNGGAGGSVYITTMKLEGSTGLISARGGVGCANATKGYTGVGGGGRVAVYFDSTNNLDQAVIAQSTVAPGVRYGTNESYDGEAGTIHWLCTRKPGFMILLR